MQSLSLTTTHILNNGTNMPALGLGVYQMTKEQVAVVMKAAFDIGCRHFILPALANTRKRARGDWREQLFNRTT